MYSDLPEQPRGGYNPRGGDRGGRGQRGQGRGRGRGGAPSTDAGPQTALQTGDQSQQSQGQAPRGRGRGGGGDRGRGDRGGRGQRGNRGGGGQSGPRSDAVGGQVGQTDALPAQAVPSAAAAANQAPPKPNGNQQQRPPKQPKQDKGPRPPKEEGRGQAKGGLPQPRQSRNNNPPAVPIAVKEPTIPFSSFALDLLDSMPRPPPNRSLLDYVASAHPGKDQLLQVLMVAEKPSVADAIAKALSGGKHNTVRHATPVHTFNSSFLSRSAQIHVTAVTGHLFSIDFPPEWNRWDKVDPVKLFEVPTERVEQKKGGIVGHIKECAKGMDALVLWLDGDREGENIAFQVWRQARNGLKGSKLGMDSVFRARFSALTPQEIRHAFANLELPNPNLALAVDVRQEIDLRIGCAFTRFQTRYYQSKYGNLDSTTISFGPCQTPTLALCVRRHDDILSFVPKPFWTLVAKADVGRSFLLRGKRFDDKAKAEKCLAALKGMKDVKVESVSPKQKSLPPPPALDTVKLLQLGSSLLHMSPQEAMRSAESLYINGYISYPRTETSRYPDTFDLASSLREISHGEYAPLAQSVLASARNGKVPVPNRGKDKGDHPPITPMRFAPEGELYGSERKVYDLVCRMFLGSLMGPLKYERTTVTVKVGTEELKASGRRLVDRGWAGACHWIWSDAGRNADHDLENEEADEEEEEEEDEGVLPADLAPGKTFPLESVSLQQGTTKPPGYLTESQLVAMMDKLGIGTDASMATHIQNVIDRGYVRVGGQNRQMVPTELGITLVHGYQQIDPDLALPTLRSSMESEIAKIAEGALPYSHVLAEQIELYKTKFEKFVVNIAGMDSLFEASFQPLSDSGKIMGRCGICKRYTKYLPLRPQRIFCPTCSRTYDLPPNGTVKLYREQTCPLDGFELVYFSTGSTGRSFVLCPKCYNEPPVEGVKPPMSCTQCTIATCPHSLAKNGLFPCPNVVGGSGARGTNATSGGVEKQCEGTVCLDGTSAPRWKVSCNTCNFAGIFNESVHGVSIVAPPAVPNIEDAAAANPGVCEDCGAVLLNISFGKKAGKEDMQGVCVVCDEEDLEGVLEAKLVKMGISRFRGRGRGRGRRGGRGRGGGHRRQRSDDGPAFGGADGRLARRGEGPSLGAFFKDI